jgi:hypothetical protein
VVNATSHPLYPREREPANEETPYKCIENNARHPDVFLIIIIIIIIIIIYDI